MGAVEMRLPSLYEPTLFSQISPPVVWLRATRRPSGSGANTLPSATATPGSLPPLPGLYGAPLSCVSPANDGVYSQMMLPVAASIANTCPSGAFVVYRTPSTATGLDSIEPQFVGLLGEPLGAPGITGLPAMIDAVHVPRLMCQTSWSWPTFDVVIWLRVEYRSPERSP